MPWIDKDKCSGCMTCVEECPAEAMAVEDAVACICDDDCIRCGCCHDVCPAEAVRHDGEKVPEEVEENIAWVTRLAGHKYFSDTQKKKALIERLKRHFQKSITVARQTIARLEIVGQQL